MLKNNQYFSLLKNYHKCQVKSWETTCIIFRSVMLSLVACLLSVQGTTIKIPSQAWRKAVGNFLISVSGLFVLFLPFSSCFILFLGSSCHSGKKCYMTSVLAGPISSDCKLLLTILSLRGKIATVRLQ